MPSTTPASRTSSSRVPSTSARPPNSDVFRPKLPFDPFTDIDQPQPWVIHRDVVRSLAAGPPSRQVILILGAPSSRDLAPLLGAASLANSLLVIVTHQPPRVPQSPLTCSVHILRTLSPLDVQDSGALRLVNILQRAAKISKQWRQSRNEPTTLQLCEDRPGGDFTVKEEFGYSPRKASTSGSPLKHAPQSTSDESPESLSRPSSRASQSSKKSGQSTSSRYLKRFKKWPTTNIQRPFDAIMNFIPSSLPEKSILKHTILVTTISQPFLASPPADLLSSPAQSPPTSFGGDGTKKRRLSIFSTPTQGGESSEALASSHSLSPPGAQPRPQRWSLLARQRPASAIYSPSASDIAIHSAPSSPTVRSYESLSAPLRNPYVATQSSGSTTNRTHLIHILPESYGMRTAATGASTKPKIVKSIEQFLLSFSYPLLHGSQSRSPPSRPTSAISISSSSSSSTRSSASSLSHIPLSSGSQAKDRERELEMEKPIPYVLSARLLGYSPMLGAQAYAEATDGVTISELVLLGALDPHVPAPLSGFLRHNTLLDGLMMNGDMPRAWIGCEGDVRVSTGSPEGSLGRHNSDEGTEEAYLEAEGAYYVSRSASGHTTGSGPLSVAVPSVVVTPEFSNHNPADGVPSPTASEHSVNANAKFNAAGVLTPPDSSSSAACSSEGGSVSGEAEGVNGDVSTHADSVVERPTRNTVANSPSPPLSGKQSAKAPPPISFPKNQIRAGQGSEDKDTSAEAKGGKSAKHKLPFPQKLRFWRTISFSR